MSSTVMLENDLKGLAVRANQTGQFDLQPLMALPELAGVTQVFCSISFNFGDLLYEVDLQQDKKILQNIRILHHMHTMPSSKVSACMLSLKGTSAVI